MIGCRCRCHAEIRTSAAQELAWEPAVQGADGCRASVFALTFSAWVHLSLAIGFRRFFCAVVAFLIESLSTAWAPNVLFYREVNNLRVQGVNMVNPIVMCNNYINDCNMCHLSFMVALRDHQPASWSPSNSSNWPGTSWRATFETQRHGMAWLQSQRATQASQSVNADSQW